MGSTSRSESASSRMGRAFPSADARGEAARRGGRQSITQCGRGYWQRQLDSQWQLPRCRCTSRDGDVGKFNPYLCSFTYGIKTSRGSQWSGWRRPSTCPFALARDDGPRIRRRRRQQQRRVSRTSARTEQTACCDSHASGDDCAVRSQSRSEEASRWTCGERKWRRRQQQRVGKGSRLNLAGGRPLFLVFCTLCICNTIPHNVNVIG